MLRDARRSARLSQRELAHRTGVAQPAISRIERGLVSPRTDTLDRLLRACGKDAEMIDRPGAGVDVSLIRERLRLSPGERARLATEEWRRTHPFRRRATP